MALDLVQRYNTRDLAVQVDSGARTVLPGTNVTFSTDPVTGEITINASGGGSGSGMEWLTINSANVSPAVDNTGYVFNTGGTLRTITLPASVPQGFRLAVNAHGGQVRIVTNGNDIDGVGIGNNLLLNDGDTASLVGRATGILEPINAIVNPVPISKGLTYDGSDRLSVVTDARGTKTFGYDGSSKLISITGTGEYVSKTFTYNGFDQLTNVTVLP